MNYLYVSNLKASVLALLSVRYEYIGSWTQAGRLVICLRYAGEWFLLTERQSL